MKIGNLTKTAMFVALMMGQVTPPETNDRNYYEDDGDFSSVSTVLHDGWGWGLNKAHAFCDTFEGTDTNCAFGGEPDEETSRYDEVTYESGGDAPAPTEPTPEPGLCEINGYQVNSAAVHAPHSIFQFEKVMDSLAIEKYLYTIQPVVKAFTKNSQASSVNKLYLKPQNQYEYYYETRSLQYPSLMKVSYVYNAAGNITDVTINDESLIGQITYQQFDKPKSWVFGNGQKRAVLYDQQKRIQHIFSDSIQDWNYKRDLADFNPQSSVSPIDKKLIVEKPHFFPVTKNNKDLEVLLYDSYQRIINIQTSDKSISYNYNALGQMSSKKINNMIVDYIYGTHGQLLAELTNGRVTKEYIYLYDELVALHQNNEIYYVFTDYLGRPEILTDVHSDIVWKASHLAFLRTVSVDKINQLNIGLPGQYWDADKHAWFSSFGDYNPLISHNPKATVEAYAYGLNHALLPLGQSESAVSNLVHYIIGNGIKKNWNFNNIDTSNITIRDFEVVQIMLANSPPGTFIITAEKGLKLSGDDWLALGNITLKLAGELEIKSNGFWTFEGGLFAKPDPYDFNPATHRSLLGEACTLAGSTLPGKEYDVIFTGSKYINQSGPR